MYRMSDSELQRYINYFQRGLLRPGSESFWEGQKDWFDKNRALIAKQYESISRGVDGRAVDLSLAVLRHEDSSEFDNFFSQQIFEPLLGKVLVLCSKGGFAPKNPVRFANSPGMEPSPAVLPSSVEHILFAGQGTFAFCNYWAKVFSAAISAIGELSKKSRGSRQAVANKFQKANVISDAARLAVYYAVHDSLIGFGKLPQAEKLKPFRALLVTSMEVFIIGHEIGHFICYEDRPETQGIAPGSSAKEHELECDVVGLSLCTAYGAEENNALAFQLIGPLLFFFALEMCEKVKSILTREGRVDSETHPGCQDRFIFALDFLKEIKASEEVMQSVQFALDVATHIGEAVELIAYDLSQSLMTSIQ
jgi:hypothetical protein